MGTSGSSQISESIENKPTGQNGKGNVLISPAEAYAIKCRERIIAQLFPDLVRSIEKVKKIENYEGVMGVVQNCPIYFLKHLECYYQGQWLDCLPHGSGIAVYKNHSYYEGQFAKGELASEDALYYFGNPKETEGNIGITSSKSATQHRNIEEPQNQKETLASYYIGKFLASKFNGRGKLVHKGLVYEGDWENGRRQGQGKEYSLEQNYSYEGDFVNSFKYGTGVYTKKLRDRIYVYEGSFYAGKFHGLGKLSIDGSEVFKGRFLNGRAEGEGALYCENGILKCIFIKDRVNGKGQFSFNQTTKDNLVGNFTDQIGFNSQTRKILLEGAQVSLGININFDELMS